MKRHWILVVMDCVSDDAWWDGLILGFAVAAVPFIAWLYLTGN